MDHKAIAGDRAFTVKATPDMVPTGSESRRTSGAMAHIPVHGIRDPEPWRTLHRPGPIRDQAEDVE